MNKIKGNRYGILFVMLICFIGFLVFSGVGSSEGSTSNREIISIQDRIAEKQGNVIEKAVEISLVGQVNQQEVEVVENFNRGEKVAETYISSRDFSHMPWYLRDSYARSQRRDKAWTKYLALDDGVRKQYDVLWNQAYLKRIPISQISKLPSWYEGWMWNEYRCSRR